MQIRIFSRWTQGTLDRNSSNASSIIQSLVKSQLLYKLFFNYVNSFISKDSKIASFRYELKIGCNFVCDDFNSK